MYNPKLIQKYSSSNKKILNAHKVAVLRVKMCVKLPESIQLNHKMVTIDKVFVVTSWTSANSKVTLFMSRLLGKVRSKLFEHTEGGPGLTWEANWTHPLNTIAVTQWQYCYTSIDCWILMDVILCNLILSKNGLSPSTDAWSSCENMLRWQSFLCCSSKIMEHDPSPKIQNASSLRPFKTMLKTNLFKSMYT